MTTGISSLDHVNILTDDIGRMSRFYADVLGLPKGVRPRFSSSGAWHYCLTQRWCIWSTARPAALLIG
jgi:catechol-2,3-dioxygenase